MKIVGSDNLARETEADHLFLEDFPDNQPELGARICDALNKILCHESGGRFYQLKPDRYRLSRGMEDFV